MVNGKKYDLIERTTEFGKKVVILAKQIPKNVVTLPLISQFVRAGTSVGANYREADDAESRNDFNHKIGISKKEARETMYWLEIISTACGEMKDKTMVLWGEAKELNLIFNAILHKSKTSV